MRRLCAEMRLGQIIKENAENQINREKLDAFDPVGFAIAADLKQNVDGCDQGEDFGQGKFQIHRTSKSIGKKYEDGRNEERDLQTRPDRDPNAEIHLVFHRHNDGGGMFGGVAYDRDDDHPNENFGDADARPHAFDGSDQELGEKRDHHSREEENHDRLAARPMLPLVLEPGLDADYNMF